MIDYIAEFEQYKDRIPEFIVKLYHILEISDYHDYLCWYGDTEILIKNGKKLQEKVLPYFFRHRHLSSFVRQLNMYKFNKVNKLTKQKNYMYFRNEHFKRDQIQEMTKIKRNNKKHKKEEKEVDIPEAHIDDDNNSEISINKQLENNTLQTYKDHVKNTVREITDSLKKIQVNHPSAKGDINLALNLCSSLMEDNPDTPEVHQILPAPMSMTLDDNLQNKNMWSTMRLLPRMESLIFPSQRSFYHIN